MDCRNPETMADEEIASHLHPISTRFPDQPTISSASENLEFYGASNDLLQQSPSLENLIHQPHGFNEEVTEKEQKYQDESLSANQDCDSFSNIVTNQKQCSIGQIDEQQPQVLATMSEQDDLSQGTGTDEFLDLNFIRSPNFCAFIEGSPEKQELQGSSLVNVCKLCNELFTSKSCYDEHSAGHKTAKGFKCYKCDYVTGKKRDLITHYDIHEDFHITFNNDILPVSYVCRYCYAEHKLESDIETHCAAHKTADGFKCLICGKLYKNRANIRKHSLKHLNNPTQEIKKVNPETQKKSARRTSSKLATDFNDDILEIKTNKTLECGSFEESIFYVCKFCDTKSESKSEALIHAASHKTEEGFKCFQCSMIMKNKLKLKIHFKKCWKSINKKHSVSRMCYICNKICNSQSSLQDHFEEHITIYGYKCHICHLVPSSQRDDLRQHYVTHSNQIHNGKYVSYPPYICKICYMNFESELEYRSHCDGHQAVNGFKCQLCFTVRSTRQSLKFHYLIHSLEIENINRKSQSKLVEDSGIKDLVDIKKRNTEIDETVLPAPILKKFKEN